jgi:squalene monooxygenase
MEHASPADGRYVGPVFLLVNTNMCPAGMTVALSDVVLLTRMLSEKLSRVPESEENPLSDWSMISRVLHKWHWSRKPLSSTLNILSVALYDLFGADGEKQSSCPISTLIIFFQITKDPSLEVLRTGCFKYFELGGECINGPVSLLSG